MERGPTLSYLFFADDFILFCEANKNQTAQLNDILCTFYHFSGQKVNRGKSQIFFSPNIPIDLADAICRDIGFVRVDDLSNYLGMPLFHKRVMTNTFDFVLNEWEVRKLSLLGRITLVKSVLLVIPNYFMSTLVSICSEIEKLARNFIWGMT
ncbi:LINE-1 reverse transcriptase isogeny [Gossypium australe]|uniref:LINE-1 reverse transcriptase isogeny n=1 Tax=Gossypium australe TaxID=47621 RepID=A0A5B6UY57_9ROSI|nr:LINE-1 reverse transcriptase isogeny [Gossypium australe]